MFSRKKTAAAYAKWCFPYGDAQRDRVKELLAELVADRDEAMMLCTYLTGRETYRGGFGVVDDETPEPELREEMFEDLKNLLRGKNRKQAPLYAALILADAAVDETLQYPAPDALRAAAEELAPAFEKNR